MYQQCKDPVTAIINNCIKRVSDNAIIPFDPTNTDYQAYLDWVAQGNQPLGAE
jgi:hypothetical protein